MSDRQKLRKKLEEDTKRKAREDKAEQVMLEVADMARLVGSASLHLPLAFFCVACFDAAVGRADAIAFVLVLARCSRTCVCKLQGFKPDQIVSKIKASGFEVERQAGA